MRSRHGRKHKRGHLMKKVMLPLAVAASAVLALSACSGSDSDNKTAAGDSGAKHVNLPFWHGYTEADGKVLDQIVDDFNKSQDEITITDVTKTWADIGDTLLTSL